MAILREKILEHDLFALPVLDRYLLYAPLHRFAALVDQTVITDLKRQLWAESFDPGTLQVGGQGIFSRKKIQPFAPADGPLTTPQFLGLITTRGCNMNCKYCDFSALTANPKPMSVNLARNCIDVYCDILQKNRASSADIQFFGGEPFVNSKVIEFTVNYAREKARSRNIAARFEVTTNGIIDEPTARWAAGNFDAVILSLDGPEAIQNFHRPLRNNKPGFQIAYRTARILGQGSSELVIRICVSAQNVSNLPQIAAWVAENFMVSKVCIEALTPSALSEINGIKAPDPVAFGVSVLHAASILENYGIETITSGTDIEQLQTSFCPVGRDALIVDPDGKINACYLLEEEWQKEGLDMVFGHCPNSAQESPGKFVFDEGALQRIRALAGIKTPLCSNCFCKYHCAGGCHVNHRDFLAAQAYDSVCLQTRLIVTGKILRQMSAVSFLNKWLDQTGEVEKTINSMDHSLPVCAHGRGNYEW
jgi:uncharacterized protein